MDTDELLTSERDKYARVWADPRYRHNAWGLKLWQTRREIFPDEVHFALDVGTGHGRLMSAWRDEGIEAWGVDIVDALDDHIRRRHGRWLIKKPIWDLARIGTFDVAVAADVLEHLPTEKVDASLKRISEVTRVLIAQTAEYPSEDWDGNPLHLTIKPCDWWAEFMTDIGGTVERLPVDANKRKIHLLKWTTGCA